MRTPTACRTLLRQCRRSSAARLSSAPARRAPIGTFAVPAVSNEPNKHYGPNTAERQALQQALQAWARRGPIEVAAVVGGKEVRSQNVTNQSNPSKHANEVAKCFYASTQDVSRAIDSALAAKPAWESLPFADRAAVFLKAADLISGKYRYEIMAATMLGQGKNAWQAEIDSAAELCDFLRFNVSYAQDLYAQQPAHHAKGVWNRLEYRPLEGFVYAISPFNFTAIGGNLAAAPALMGNVVLWKPSPSALASNYLLYQIFLEAGLPPNVIQFVPGDAEEVTKQILDHPEFSALHYTGSTSVFRHLYGKIGQGIANATYKGYPRIVGETGGKNFHVIHSSADVKNAALQTIRGAFEYSGQKCSATSRAYVPKSLYDDFRDLLVKETEALKQGPPEDFANFLGPVIHEASFNKLRRVIDDSKHDSSIELLAGGRYDDSEGYYIRPTIYRCSDAMHPVMKTEFFGPILGLYVYDDSKPNAFEDICQLVNDSSAYALTGSIFAQERQAINQAERLLQNAAGNFYINCKSTGAVVGQQPFGGARASGTNDKAGSAALLSRFVSMRSMKEEFEPTNNVLYLSNEVGGV